MLQDGNRFCDLVAAFKELRNDAWFGHPLLVALFHTHWNETRRVIIKRGLLPFVLYFVTSLILSHYYVS